MTLFRLPADLLGHLVTFFLGDYKRSRDGKISKDQKNAFPGVLGMITGSVAGVFWLISTLGKNITHFIKSNRDTIASAFWSAVFLGSLAALIVGFWPSALALVANYAIGGYSIASLFGTKFAMQVAAIGGLAASVSAGAVFSLAAITAGLQTVLRCCCPQSAAAAEDFNVSEHEEYTHSASALSQLGGTSPAAPLYTLMPARARRAMREERSLSVDEPQESPLIYQMR